MYEVKLALGWVDGIQRTQYARARRVLPGYAPGLVSVPQVARALGLSEWAVRRKLRSHRLRGVKIAGGVWRVAPADLKSYVDSRYLTASG